MYSKLGEFCFRDLLLFFAVDLEIWARLSCLDDIFEFFIKRKTKYSLRGRNKLVIPQPRTEILRRSIAYRGAVNWNYLEESLQEKGYTVFKKLVKKHLDDVPMKPNLKPNDCDFIYS